MKTINSCPENAIIKFVERKIRNEIDGVEWINKIHWWLSYGIMNKKIMSSWWCIPACDDIMNVLTKPIFLLSSDAFRFHHGWIFNNAERKRLLYRFWHCQDFMTHGRKNKEEQQKKIHCVLTIDKLNSFALSMQHKFILHTIVKMICGWRQMQWQPTESNALKHQKRAIKSKSSNLRNT